MLRKLRSWLAGICLLPVMGGAAAFVATDARGVRVAFDAPPQRIVTLLPSLTETVCALDACDRLVGTDRFSDWPPSVRQLPKLGGLEDTQLERLYALKPDLVLAARSSRVLARLDTLGIPVLALEPQSLADMQDAVRTVAQVLGRPEAGAALLARIDADIEHAAARVPADWRGARVYFEVSAAPYAAGASSFVGELLARLGLGNVVPAALGAFPKLNPEYVVRAQPELLMAPRRNIERMRQRPGWEAIPALAAGRQCGFEPARYEVLTRPGPRLGEAAAMLADCIAGLPARPGGAR